MIRVTSNAASDLFFPDPKDGTKGITLKRLEPTDFNISDLPAEVFKRFRIMAEDKQAILETTEEIPPLDGLPRIAAKANAVEPKEEKLKTAEPARSPR
jgi:hypothetical protein